MHCTVKKTFAVAAEANIALIVQVKDNQPTLLQHCEAIAAAPAPNGSVISRDKGRNRHECRTVTVFDPAGRLANTGWQDHIATIICVEREVYTRKTDTGLLARSHETAFYVANTTLTAERAAEATRGHWAIESVPQGHTGKEFAMN